MESGNKMLAQQMVKLTSKARNDRETLESLLETEKALKTRVNVLQQKNKTSSVIYIMARLGSITICDGELMTVQREMEDKERADKREQKRMVADLEDLGRQYEAEVVQHQKTKLVLAETVKKVKGNIRDIKQRAMEKDALLEKLERKRALFRQHLQRAGATMHQPGGGMVHAPNIMHSNPNASRMGHYR